jgi:hypothetical protein
MNEYIGKRVLVGLSVYNAKDELVGRQEVFGEIKEVSEEGVFLERADGKGEFVLPPNVDELDVARPGRYELKNTNRVIVDPDFLSIYNIRIDEDDVSVEDAEEILSENSGWTEYREE